MKRKDLNMEILKEWGSPRSNVQLFMPQEYFASCWEKVTTLSSARTLFIDMNKNNTYQTWEKFVSGYSGGASANKEYSDIPIFYVHKVGSTSPESSPTSPSSNQSYSSTYNNGYYAFGLVGTFDVKVDGSHNAYYKVHEAS